MEALPETDRFEKIRKMVEEAAEEEKMTYPAPLLLAAPILAVTPGISSQDLLDALRDNEDGDARMFIRLNQGKLCFDHSIERWYRWAENYWEADGSGNVYLGLDSVIQKYTEEAQRQAQARQVAAASHNKASAQQAKHLEDKLLARVFSLQTVFRKKNILFLAAQGTISLGISGKEWDRDPWILGCRNGVVDLRNRDIQAGQTRRLYKDGRSLRMEKPGGASSSLGEVS